MNPFKMKRKYADRRGWRRIISSRTSSRIFMWPSFHGEGVLLTFEEVRAPLSVIYGGTRTKTVDQQYSWLQLFPNPSAHAVLTAMFNDQKELVQCYFDVTYREGRDPDGVLWFDDLYLDIILFPNHDLYLVDEDELNEALRSGIITSDMHRLAWRTARRLMDFIKSSPDYYLHLARSLRRTFPG
ncbi:DUF402 domain-containing protein [Sporolactobacillus sp. THM7-7]|nr:DUF402 domain-containing protein [Sporolactobacillus sp. THM7-7]